MHAHLPTPCYNVALSMSGKQWESWTYFDFIVLNMWIKHKLFDFHGPVTLLHLFLVSWLKIKIKINLTLRRLWICSETTVINCTHINIIIIIQFKEWVKKKKKLEKYCRIKVVTKRLSLRDLMRECMRSCQVAL